MSDLVEFLKARLDEDEDLAREAADGLYPGDGPDDYVHRLVSSESDCTDGQYRHADRWNPFRVLAEVAAKRAIVDAYVLRDEQGQMPGGEVIGYHATGVRTALRHLAAVYADHPDYLDEWRP